MTYYWERLKVGELIEDYVKNNVEKTTIQNQYPVLTFWMFRILSVIPKYNGKLRKPG